MRYLLGMTLSLLLPHLACAACASIDPDTVVFVETYFEFDNGERELYGTGTGVLVRPQGYVLTAKHLQPSSAGVGVQVVSYGTLRSREGTRYKLSPYPGPVIQADAVLLSFASDVRDRWPYLELDATADIAVGTTVAAWGFPLDAGRARMEGYVTSLDGLNGTVQLDSRLARGMSGGPVVNDSCRLIGIVTGGSRTDGFQFFTPHVQLLPLLAPFGQTIPAQTTTASKQFPVCRDPSHGLEKWGREDKWSADSGWIGGGNNPASYCGGVKLQREAVYKDRTVRLLETGERHKSEYSPFKHDFYRYSCTFIDLWEPIYKAMSSANCLPQAAR